MSYQKHNPEICQYETADHVKSQPLPTSVSRTRLAQSNIEHLIYFTILPCFIEKCKHNGIQLHTKEMYRTLHF